MQSQDVGWGWTTTRGILALALLALLLLGVWRMSPTGPVLQADRSNASIAVLPFNDLSPDRNLGHFADGITEDLITDLARWEEFDVTARISAMTYKDIAFDIREVAADMNTHYLLEGSVRRFGDEMRITVQLIDGKTGNHVWAERFEETDSDILALQDSVIGKTVQSLIGNYGAIRKDEIAHTWARAEADLDEYEYYLRGHALFYHYTPEDNARAIEIWEEGLTKYPSSGLLKIKLGWGYYFAGLMGDAANARTQEQVLAMALESVADPKLAPAGHRFGLWLLSELYSELGQRKETLATVERTMRAYPLDGEGLSYAADDLTAVGEYERVRDLYQRVADMKYPLNAIGLAEEGALDYALGDCVAAVPKLEQFQVYDSTLLLLAGCYADDGRTEAALTVLVKAERNDGIISPADFPARFANMPGVTERLTAQLAQVGWPN
ncbi:MAG: hypothetical protein AB8B58_06990 [Roseobacter sp.]